MHPARRSIAIRLLMQIIPIALLGIASIGASAYFLIKNHFIRTVKHDVQTLGYEAAQNISTFLNQRRHDLEMLSESPVFPQHYTNLEFQLWEEADMYRQEIEGFLQRFFDRTGVYHGIAYFTAEGKLVSEASRLNSGHSRALLSQISFDKDIFISTPAALTLSEIALVYAKVLRDPLNRHRGTLLLISDFGFVREILNRLETGPSSVAMLVDENERILYPLKAAGAPTAVSARPADHFTQTTDIAGTSWKISLTSDLRNFLEPLFDVKVTSSLLMAICGVFVVMFIYFRVRRLIQPVTLLVKATQGMAKGDLGGRVIVAGDDEIGVLSRSFNSMADAIEKRDNENKNLLETVLRSETRYRTTVNNSLDAIIGTDNNFHITTWNQGAENLFHYNADEILGRNIASLFPDDAGQQLIERVGLAGELRNHDVDGFTKEGDLISLSISWSGSGPAGNKEWSIVMRDVTEQKMMQSQLIHAEKLSVVGRLVSGVAHEINNPLTAVVGYSELLSKDQDVPGHLREDLQYIFENAIRCRDIVGNLLRFVRRNQPKRKEININDVVNSALKLMEYRLVKSESIRTRCNLTSSLPAVNADFQQLEQVVINLIQNACDAMAGMTREKVIEIKTEAEAGRVFLHIADNGPGIPARLREKIFEPFFTTKEEGKGTGLGLAISREIIEKHEGEISVQDGVPLGTCFIIALPAHS
jgi:PAS domain S-box-containing protein